MKTNFLFLLLVISCPAGSVSREPTQAPCPPCVTVREAISDPKFVGHEIALTGTAVSVIALGTLGWFRLDDGTGTISVTISGAVPRDSEGIHVVGILHQVVVLGHLRKVVLRAERWQRVSAPETPGKTAASHQ